MGRRKLIGALGSAALLALSAASTPGQAGPSTPANHASSSLATKQNAHNIQPKAKAKTTTKKVAKELSEDQAVDAVSKLPEVKKWSKLLSSTKGAGNPGYMAERDGAKWVVQVFESKSEQNVTFGYYDVDARTGTVKKEEP